MWKSLTKKDKECINELVDYFKGRFPRVSEDVLYNRIYSGYCWGEGGSRILTKEDWDEVFGYTKIGQLLFTCFKSWEDYNKYNGDWHIKKQE